MKAADFHNEFQRLGQMSLAPKGFVYRDKSWHHTTKTHQLSFCPHRTKFGHGFSVRYLTVALWHLDVEPPSNIEFRPLRNDCGVSPVKISPALLRPHTESGFDDQVWDCPDALEWTTHLKTCLPVYFGGEDMWILADQSASREMNRQALLHSLEKDGVHDLRESAAIERIETACEEVGRYGLEWAEAMTIEKVAPLIIQRAKTSADLGVYYYAPQYAKAIAR